MLHVLGEIELALDDPDAALEFFWEARDLRAELRGPDDATTQNTRLWIEEAERQAAR
jgi:hypothetical protein